METVNRKRKWLYDETSITTTGGVEDGGFVDAAQRGDLVELERQLQTKGDSLVFANSPHWFRKTGLHRACYYGRLQVLEFLLERGAIVNAVDAFGSTPLHEAVDGGSVATVEILQRLLRHGANVNARNRYKQTALHAAVKKQHAAAVQCLLEHAQVAVRVDATDDEGYTPLRLAIESYQEEDQQQQQQPSSSASLNSTPSSSSSKGQLLEIIHRLIVNAGADCEINCYKDGCMFTPLHWAVRHNHKAMVTAMLTTHKTASVDAIDSQGCTALHVAAACGLSGMCRKLLVEGSADIHAANELEDTPLHLACQMGHKDIIRRLLRAGADKRMINKDGKTPLQVAMECGHGDDILSVLQPAAAQQPVQQQ